MKRLFAILLITALAISLVFTLSGFGAAAAPERIMAVGTVNSPMGLYLRSRPERSAPVIATAHENDTVVILERCGDWYKVNYNLYVGYMARAYLDGVKSFEGDLGAATVTGSGAAYYAQPLAESEPLGQLTEGEQVRLTGLRCGWYEVVKDGARVYVPSEALELSEKPAGNQGLSAKEQPTASVLGRQIADYTLAFVGYSYVYGGESPSGFDCSGLMYYVYGQYGYTLNRGATSQLKNGEYVSMANLQPGDLVFFGYGSTATHVGMYIGDGNFVHAQSSRTGVVITALSDEWYANRYLTARRIII